MVLQLAESSRMVTDEPYGGELKICNKSREPIS